MTRKKVYIFSLFCTVFLLSSCSIKELATHRVNKALKKTGEQKGTLPIDGGSMHYRICGAGTDTVLLVHGFGPLPHLQWEHQIEPLAENAVLIIPDLVYFGESFSSSEQYSLDFQAQNLAQLLDTLSVQKAHVVGLSYGGMVSMWMANYYPEKIETLTLVDALNPYYSKQMADSIARSFNRSHITDLLIPSDAQTVKDIFSITYSKPKKYPKVVRKKIAEKVYNQQIEDKKKLIFWLENNEPQIVGTDLMFSCAVNLIWGQQDAIIPVQTGHRFAKKYGATIHVLSNTGHVANIESPDLTNSILKTIIFSDQ